MTPVVARAAALARLADEPFDLLVVGGGITGAGVARDAARRGLRVALVERDDLASGTSSRSSRLIHGGVRYLEHGHLGLVFEASRERRTLLGTAPHLVRPLAFTWPVYRGARVPRWKLRAGLALYDALALFGNVGRHRALGRDEVLAREPSLRADGLLGGATYWDAATDDARLTLATALAARDAGATVVTHAEVRALALSAPAAGGDGARATVRVVDRLGDAPPLDVRARAVVNCAGPWGDHVRRLVDRDAPPAVLGAKGVHLQLAPGRVPHHRALTLVSPLDGRVMFVLPSDAGTIVGTTETPAERGPDAVRATTGDLDYLLRSVDAFFPEARLDRDDVVSAWAGIRPLAATGARSGARSGARGGTASASREHAIEVDPRGVVHVSGGKLTTYRAMAAGIVDACAPLLGGRPAPADTAQASLPGGEGPLDEVERAARARILDGAVARRLARAHGTRWAAVWAQTKQAPALAARVVPELPYVGAEFVYAAREEEGWTLADLLVRRTTLAYETRDAGRAAARVVAPLVAPVLGWDADAAARAVTAYDAEADRLFGIDP